MGRDLAARADVAAGLTAGGSLRVAESQSLRGVVA